MYNQVFSRKNVHRKVAQIDTEIGKLVAEMLADAV